VVSAEYKRYMATLFFFFFFFNQRVVGASISHAGSLRGTKPQVGESSRITERIQLRYLVLKSVITLILERHNSSIEYETITQFIHVIEPNIVLGHDNFEKLIVRQDD
jgi:hypothetical protein